MKKNKKYDLFENFRRKAPLEIVVHCMVALLFAIVSFSYLYMVLWCIVAGFRTHSEIVLDPFAFPTTWHWENLLDLPKLLHVGDNTFWDMLFNSFVFSFVGTFFNLFVQLQFAYVCAKYKFPGSKYVVAIIMIIMTIPLYGTGGGLYTLYAKLGLIDSYAQLLVFGSVTATSTLYFMSFFENLSWSYAEAAMMDGANHFTIFYRVMLPQAWPMFGALFIMGWKGGWNDYSSSMIYHPKLPTLAYGIYQFSTEMMYQARLDILFAACAVASVPAVILYIACNKGITTSVSLGGLKG